MPPIKHTQLFDFPAYEQGIKDAKAATVDLAKTVEGVLSRLSVQQKDLVAGLGEYAQIMKGFSVVQAGATDNLKRYNQEIDEQVESLGRLKETQKGWSQIVDISKASVAELRAEYGNLKKQYENLKPTQDGYAAQVAAIKSRIQEVVPGIQQFTNATRVNQNVVQAAEGSYTRMQQELTALRAQLRTMPGAFDEVTGKMNKNNIEAVNMAQRIGQLDKTLKMADETMGLYVRNVGNYKSGFNGLNVSVAQLTREIPNFAMNLQTGFLAISNNIPMLKDEIDRLKIANRDLISQGEKPISIWKQLGSAVFSWNTLLSVGITVLTVYGKQIVQFIASLFGSKKAIDQERESFILLNKAVSGTEFTNAIKNVNELRINIDLAKRGFIDKKDVVDQYNHTIGETTGQVKNLEEAEVALQKNADNYIKMTLYKAAAQLALQEAAKKAFEAEQERLKKEKEFSKFGETGTSAFAGYGGADAIRKAEAEVSAARQKRREAAAKELETEGQAFENIAKKFQESAAKIATANKFDFFSDITKDANAAKKSSDDLQKQMEARVRGQQELLKSGAELQIKADELRLAKEQINEEEFQKGKLETIRSYLAKSLDLEQSLGKAADKKRIDDLKRTLVDAELDFAKFEESRFKRVHFAQPTRVGTGPAPDTQTTDEMLKAFDLTAKRQVDAEDKAFDIIRAGRDTSFREELAHLERLKAIRLKFAQSTAEEEYAIAKIKAERERQLELDTRQFVIDAISTGLQIAQELTQARSANRLADLEEQRQAELKLAGNNAAAREKIEKDYQAKVKKEKRKAAQDDKIFALFNVALNTAQGVTKTIAEWGMPFAIPFIFLTIGQGLLQAALIAAKPLPQARHGSKSAPSGPIITGEEGFEIVKDKKTGNLRFTGRYGPQIDIMQGGEEIFTHAESRRILERGIKVQSLEQQQRQDALASQLRKGRAQEIAYLQGLGFSERQTDKLITAIKSQPKQGDIRDERGWRKYREEQNQRTEYLNKNHAF